MQIVFVKVATEDLKYWRENNISIFKKILSLVENIKSTPFSGIGKPEPLGFDRAGYWSRRINREHRLVYKVEGGKVAIIQCRHHYQK